MEMLLYLVPVFGILGLLFAAYLAARVGRQDAGNDRMKEIAAAISDGAQAFLTAEYKILVIFVAVLFVLIGFGIGNWITAVCFVVGALFSTLAGFCGMKVATKANVRTANHLTAISPMHPSDPGILPRLPDIIHNIPSD